MKFMITQNALLLALGKFAGNKLDSALCKHLTFLSNCD